MQRCGSQHFYLATRRYTYQPDQTRRLKRGEPSRVFVENHVGLRACRGGPVLSIRTDIRQANRGHRAQSPCQDYQSNLRHRLQNRVVLQQMRCEADLHRQSVRVLALTAALDSTNVFPRLRISIVQFSDTALRPACRPAQQVVRRFNSIARGTFVMEDTPGIDDIEGAKHQAARNPTAT